jgi:hypothetical protein
MKKLAMIAALALMVGASGSALAAAHSGGAVSKKDAAAAIGAAIQETNAAAKVQYEWRDTYKIIGKAKKAYKKGDYAKAKKLAHKAKKQSEMAQVQQKAEMHADVPGYVRAASK